MIDVGPPPLVFPKPAIIRAASDLGRHDRGVIEREFGVKFSEPAKAILPGVGAVAGWVRSLPFGPLAVSCVDTAWSDSSVGTFSMSFGEAHNHRHLILGLHGSQNSSIPGVNVGIGGITASPVVWVQASPTNNWHGWAGLFMAHVPTGTSGNVVLSSWGGSAPSRRNLALWRVTGISPDKTPFATASDVTDASNALSASLEIPVGGFAVGSALLVATSSRTTSWMNMDIEDEDTNTYSSTSHLAAAHHLEAGAATRTVTASGALNSTNYHTLVMASWGPN